MQLKKHNKNKKTNSKGPTGLYEMFSLSVPIEKAARYQYYTVLIIFPLNLQTIIITIEMLSNGGEGALRHGGVICLHLDPSTK